MNMKSDKSQRQALFEFKLPITFGVYDFDWAEVIGGNIPDRLSQVSIVPGIEVEIPMSRRWTIRPLAHLGYGIEADGENAAWIYWLALKSQLTFKIKEFNLFLLNSLGWYGFAPDKGNAQRLAGLTTGFEGHYPLRFLNAEDPWYIKAHILNFWYLNDIEVVSPEGTEPLTIDAEWEFALALGKQKRIKIWIFSFDRIGLAYRFSDIIKGVRFYFSAWFNTY